MGKRKRIIKKPEELDVVYDDESYTSNACSDNAKFKNTFNENLEIEFWIDKHYSYREMEREGIGIEVVEALVKKSFIHILYYSSKHNFIFVNHPPKKQRGIRFVIQHIFPKKEKLNIVVEYHFLKLNLLEITVITALCKDDYYLFDGQYAIEFHEDESVLYFNEKGITSEIDDYNE